MPFDYMYSDVPQRFTSAPEKAKAMYRRELVERAAMLRRLGYTRDEARVRLETNFEWDWEVNETPVELAGLQDEIRSVVEEVYSR